MGTEPPSVPASLPAPAKVASLPPLLPPCGNLAPKAEGSSWGGVTDCSRKPGRRVLLMQDFSLRSLRLNLSRHLR